MNEETSMYINKKIAYTALLLQEYAYREILDSPLVRGEGKYIMKTKLKYVQNQLLQINKNSKATREQIKHGEDVILDNVSLMASIVGTLAIVPSSQVDYIESEFTKLCLIAIERNKKLEDGRKQ
tara:strand:- start:769 stop:1140 length:372 start_codon:yes stop_codon:yes gene_type:complete